MYTSSLLLAMLVATTSASGTVGSRAQVDLTAQKGGHEQHEVPVVGKLTGTGIITQCKQPGHFAATFDDSSWIYGPSIAKAFEVLQGRATFFVTGNKHGCIYDHAEDLQARYKAGHTLASHTWDHSDITGLTSAQFNQQLTQVETAFEKILGVKPALFRPPGGSIDERTFNILRARGYDVVLSPPEQSGPNVTTVTNLLKNVGSIGRGYPKPQLLVDDNADLGLLSAALPEAIALLNAKGYKLVTVDECVGIKPYQSIGQPGKRDSTWNCDA